MLKDNLVGKYIPQDSVIHHLDPRAKFLAFFLLMLIVFIANSVVTYGVLIAVALILTLFAKFNISYVLNGLKPILLIVLFAFFVHLFTTKGGELLWSWQFLSIYSNGLVQGIFISLRFILLMYFATILTLSTSPIELTQGIESLCAPLKVIGIPVESIALMMSIAIRFIPTLIDELDLIRRAQAARGADVAMGSLSARFKALQALVIPIFIQSFKRAEDLANAMEARGYDTNVQRTYYKVLTWKFKDTLIIISVMCIGVLLILLRLNNI